jgi:hypothetical protein
MRKANPLPPATAIRAAFDYNPETGILSWKKRPGIDKPANVFNAEFAGKPTGCPNGCGYLRVLWNKKHYVAHRLAWVHFYGSEPTRAVDHINGNRADNRIANLREANDSQNMVNARNRPMNKTGFRGVTLRRDGRFYAGTRIKGASVSFGYHNTASEAARAYEDGIRQIHGDFLPTESEPRSA